MSKQLAIALDKLLMAAIIAIGLFCFITDSLAQCPNDLCVNAVEIGCYLTEFDNYDCTIYDFQNSGMSRLVGNCNNSFMSNCGGNDYTSVHTDLWFGAYLAAGFYDLNVFTNYSCTVCSPSGSKGVSVFVWYTDGSCEDAVISYARNCPGAACWSGNIGEVYGEVSEYGPQDHSLTIEFLSSGQYYIQVQAWGWGPGHPDFLDYSKGEGTISICPTTPLSSVPVLTAYARTLSWTGHTSTDFAIIKVDGQQPEILAHTTDHSFTVSENGMYIVASSRGYSNSVTINVVEVGGKHSGVDALGRQGVEKGIIFDY